MKNSVFPVGNQRLCLILAFLAIALLQACATSPYSTENKARSDALLAAQLAKVKQAQADAAPRLFVLAAAFHDQSKAFRGDVEATASKLLQLQPQAIVVKLANPAIGQSSDLPYAVRENLSTAVQTIASAMREQDRAVIMLTTHGNVDALAVHAGSQAYANITGKDLQNILQPLEKFTHGVIISACFSGSLIAPLQSAKRWILTAAAANRASFGCQFHGSQTYYINALLNQNINANTQFRTWHTQARQAVMERERAEKLSPSSEPQFYLPAQFVTPVLLGQLLAF